MFVWHVQCNLDFFYKKKRCKENKWLDMCVILIIIIIRTKTLSGVRSMKN